MRNAEPFHSDMEDFFGEHSLTAERELWIGAAILGAFACKVVYDAMKEYSPQYFSCYNKLPRVKQVEWDNRGFSTAHAIWCGVAAGYLLFVSDVFCDDTPHGPVAFRSTIFSNFTIAFSTGYFISDLAMILWTYPSLGGPEYVVHHLLSIGSVVLANYTAHAHFYILMVLFSEVTTPFINMRWYLVVSGKKDSKYYLYNGLALLFVWLFARVLMFIYFFYHIYLHYDEESKLLQFLHFFSLQFLSNIGIKQLYAPGFYFMFTAPPGLAVMNLFWFYKIVVGALKTLARSKKE